VPQHLKSGGGRANLAGDIQSITDARAGAGQRLPTLYRPDRSDVDGDRTGGASQIAADNVDAVRGCEAGEAEGDRVKVRDRQIGRKRHRHQREPRRRAHRGEIAEVDREGAVADRVGRDEPAVEVDTFHQRIDGEDLDAVPLWFDHCRIVADADNQPVGCGGKTLRDPGDQFALGEVGNGHFA
jgi:hypothetical protein